MLRDELHLKKQEIESLATKFGAKNIRIFGSVAKGTERDDSDIDFLVEFPKGYDLFNQRLPLQEALSALTSRNIDLLPEHEINKHLRDSILQEARSL
jgi:predicted nucleotidyltransferase